MNKSQKLIDAIEKIESPELRLEILQHVNALFTNEAATPDMPVAQFSGVVKKSKPWTDGLPFSKTKDTPMGWKRNPITREISGKPYQVIAVVGTHSQHIQLNSFPQQRA